ncbi:MAG: hypothetical protein RLZZ519_947, partial [Bacteroidota bacterium]
TFGETLLQDKEAQAARLIAISSLLWEENDVAAEWALRSLKKLEAEIANVEEIPLWHAPELDILELAKVFRKLGRPQEEELLRRHLNKLLPGLQTGRDAGMEAVRLAVELGYDQEAETLALKLSPLLVGHSRGALTSRLFRTLLSHNKQILAWSLFAMTAEAHDEASLRDSAVEAACELGDFELALKFSANDGIAAFQDSPLLVTIANWLIHHHRTHEWRAIWAMLTEQKFGLYHRFSTENQLKFLAKIVEHADPKDRKEIFKISNRIQKSWATSPNSELAQEIANINLVIGVWGASKATLQKLILEAKIPKHGAFPVLRAAAERGFLFLLDLVPEGQSTNLIQDAMSALRFEWELKQRGKRNRLEKVFYESLRKAITTNDQAMLYNIKTFVGRTWKNLELYRELLTKYPSHIGLTFVDIWPFTKPHVAAGDLLGLESELLKISDAYCISETSRDLYSCLRQRFGLEDELENF